MSNMLLILLTVVWTKFYLEEMVATLKVP